MSRSFSITAPRTRSPNLSSRITLTHEVSGRPGRAVSSSMAASTERTSGETTATSNSPEKKPPRSLGRRSVPLHLLRTQRSERNSPALIPLPDNSSIGPV